MMTVCPLHRFVLVYHRFALHRQDSYKGSQYTSSLISGNQRRSLPLKTIPQSHRPFPHLASTAHLSNSTNHNTLSLSFPSSLSNPQSSILNLHCLPMIRTNPAATVSMPSIPRTQGTRREMLWDIFINDKTT